MPICTSALWTVQFSECTLIYSKDYMPNLKSNHFYLSDSIKILVLDLVVFNIKFNMTYYIAAGIRVRTCSLAVLYDRQYSNTST